MLEALIEEVRFILDPAVKICTLYLSTLDGFLLPPNMGVLSLFTRQSNSETYISSPIKLGKVAMKQTEQKVETKKIGVFGQVINSPIKVGDKRKASPQ